jgi:molybdate transport system substrate-binding protein
VFTFARILQTSNHATQNLFQEVRERNNRKSQEPFMKKLHAAFAFGFILTLTQAVPAFAQSNGPTIADAKPGEIRVMVTAAIRVPLEAVRAQAEHAVGHPLVIEYGSARGNLKGEILAGQAFEVAILLPDVDEQLLKQNKIAGKGVTIARVDIAIGQRGDVPKIDISTPEAIKKALLNAKSLKWSPTGAALLTVNKILSTLGIEDAIKNKVNMPDKVELGHGEYELNINPLSEILPNKNVMNLGVVPAPLQVPAIVTATIGKNASDMKAAKALIEFLKGPALDPALKADGMMR